MLWVQVKIRVPAAVVVVVAVFFFFFEWYPQDRFFGKDSYWPMVKILWA